MSKEKTEVRIPVERYKDSKGNPTCGLNVENGEFCSFFRVAGLCGQYETCLFAPRMDGRTKSMPLERQCREKDDNIPTGYLIPGDWCPVWQMGTEKSLVGAITVITRSKSGRVLTPKEFVTAPKGCYRLILLYLDDRDYEYAEIIADFADREWGERTRDALKGQTGQQFVLYGDDAHG